MFQRQLDEAGPAGEVDLVGFPGGAVGLVVAARVDEERRIAAKRRRHVRGRGGNGAVAFEQRAQSGHLEHEIVGELMETTVSAEVVVEVLAEHERVGDQRAPEWLPTSSTGPSFGMCSRPRTSDRKYSWGGEPHGGERALDVQRVAERERVALATVGDRGGEVFAECRKHAHVRLGRAQRGAQRLCQSRCHIRALPRYRRATRARGAGVRRRVPPGDRRRVDDRGRRLAVEQEPVEHLGEVLDRARGGA